MGYYDTLVKIVEEGIKNPPGPVFSAVRFLSSPLFLWLKDTAKEMDKPRIRVYPDSDTSEV